MQAFKPSDAPGACTHTMHHVTSFDERNRVWRYECVKCLAIWATPMNDGDVPLITALRGGRPLLNVVK